MDSEGCILGLCVQMSSARNKPGLQQEETGSAARGLSMVASLCSGVPHKEGSCLGARQSFPGLGRQLQASWPKEFVLLVALVSAALWLGVAGGGGEMVLSSGSSPSLSDLSHHLRGWMPGARPNVKQVLCCPDWQMMIWRLREGELFAQPKDPKSCGLA